MENIILFPVPIVDIHDMIERAVQGALDNWRPSQPEPESQLQVDGLATMTRAEVLEALRCSPPTLLLLEKRGELCPCKRIGRKPLWLRSEVEAFLFGRDGR